MQNLTHILKNVEQDNRFTVLAVLKETPSGRTEKVMYADGRVYIRKYLPLGTQYATNEFEILSRLNHPYFPKVYDHFELSDRHVLIEEFVEGTKLTDLMRQKGGIPQYAAFNIAMQLCEATMYLHGRPGVPVIHRDIKPDNIIYTPVGHIKLIDFGAARQFKQQQNRDTVYVGTPGYAPPEQFGFGQTDERADVYAIGMTLLHMLTGRVPERGERANLAFTGMPVPLQFLLEKAIAFDPTLRYASAAEFWENLNAYTYTGQGMPQKRASERPRLLRPSQKIYPRHNNWPVAVKVALMPLHLFMLLAVVVTLANAIFVPTGFGATDSLLQNVSHAIVFLFVLFPPYILGFNLFNINQRVRFFHRHRLVKKTLIVMGLIVAAGLLFGVIQDNYSEAYRLAHY